MRFEFVFTGMVLGATLVAGQSAVRQDGPYWERSGRTQPIAVSPNIKQLNLFTRGQVTVRGGDAQHIQIAMKQRVMAKTQAEANREWGIYDVLQAPVIVNQGAISIGMQPPATLRVSTDLEITVPRGLRLLHVQNQIGDVQIYDLDGDVEAITDGGAIRADRIKGRFRCTTGFGNVTTGSTGGDMNCHTAGGDLEVGQVGGALTLHTEGGNIHVDKAGGQVRATSREGMIEIGEAKGIVTADTRGGLIQVGSAAGVKAESAAGMVRLKGASGPMNVNTMMGNILAELLGGGKLQNSSLATNRGDITLMLPANLPVTLRALHPSGMAPRIVSEFPEIGGRSVGWTSPAAAQGVLNGGGPVLNLNTSGVIYIRKSKE